MFQGSRPARRNSRRGNGNGNHSGFRKYASERAALSKIVICLAFSALTALTILIPGPPFQFHEGEAIDRDIRSRTAFDVVNRVRTARLRDEAAESVPPIFVNDPAPIETLYQQVLMLSKEVLKADEFGSIPESTVLEWNLKPTQFQLLREPLLRPETQAQFQTAIENLFGLLIQHGVLNIIDLPQLARASTVRVTRKGRKSAEPTDWDIQTVDRTSLLRLEGPLGSEFIDAAGGQESARLWFGMIAARLKVVPATLKYDQDSTSQARHTARSEVALQRDFYDSGDLLVMRSQDQGTIGTTEIELLRAEHDKYVENRTTEQLVTRAGSLSALVVALFVLCGYYVARYETRLAASPLRISLLGCLIVGTLATAKLANSFLPDSLFWFEIVPMLLASMTITIAYNQQFALLITFALGLLSAWMFGTDVSDFVILTGGMATAILALNRVRSRTKLITVGAWAGGVSCAICWSTGLLHDLPITLLWKESLLLVCWSLLSGFLMTGCLPFLESIFGIVTDMRLLELSDVSHPLLQRLVREAPGTYNHSISVATLGASAAEVIGANSLLFRVGCYFHDIGKMLKPQYFIENQTDSVNRHESLHPTMSTLIIIGHVRDGIQLAREHHLPDPIIDLIQQHHGTTLIEYFYHEAAKDAEEDWESETDVEEDAFRYPGPKPQSKEACVLMLADAAESACRTLNEPTAKRIERLVNELALKRLLDGQFDDCSITLHEIGLIKVSLIKSLTAFYHGRVKYPEPQIA